MGDSSIRTMPRAGSWPAGPASRAGTTSSSRSPPVRACRWCGPVAAPTLRWGGFALRGQLGIRWTIGDVSDRGFHALRLSIQGAWRLFGADARYAVCVNTLPLEVVRARTGAVPAPVAWID